MTDINPEYLDEWWGFPRDGEPQGPQGPPGPTGPEGPAGPAGSGDIVAGEGIEVDIAGDTITISLDEDATVIVQQGSVDGTQETWAVQDDFNTGEVLADQTGAGAVLTFTFTVPVNLVVLESSGLALVSRADPFGGTPAASTGVPLRHETPTFLPVITSSVKVYAPVGATVSCYGYMRG